MATTVRPRPALTQALGFVHRERMLRSGNRPGRVWAEALRYRKYALQQGAMCRWTDLEQVSSGPR